MVVLCKGTGSVDDVFKLAGFKVIAIDWVHAFTTGKVKQDPSDLLLNLTDWTPEQLYFGVFTKTSKINDKTREYGLSDDSQIKSSYSWKTPRVTIHDNDTPRSLINTLGIA